MHGITGGSLEQVVDNSGYEQLAVNLIKMYYTLVGIDNILKVRNFRCDEREVMVIKILLIELDDFRQLKVAVEIGHGHDAARERAAHRHHVEL